MKIEFFSELNDYNQVPVILNVLDINESFTIGELFSKIHEMTEIPVFRELKWGGNVEKISCSYYYKSGNEFGEFTIIENLNQKINSFPKNGFNNELSLFIDGGIGLVN
ncbi:hypothetical protein [Flavobacterium chungangense]|uniref:hypothetical protein n=1 Tax=Flavobacterium chungangense TaxID=554283 RepID=UPI0004DEDCE9|nr:hypothetical protein [Flavobacterium chungangense]